MNRIKVSVIGFGHIGSVISAVLASSGCKVTGIDNNLELIKSFREGELPIYEPGLQDLIREGLERNLSITSSLKSVTTADVVLITIGTPLGNNFKPDLTGLVKVCKEIEPLLKNGQLVIIKSTVPVGITRNLVEHELTRNKSLDIAFSPERLAEGNAIKELTSLPIVVGGTSKIANKRASNFWEKWLGVKVIQVQNAETAEMVKLANNAWIDLNIALANDLARLTDTLNQNIDILEVIEAANSLKKGTSFVNILSPSNGVGGYCLTKDPWFLYQLGLSNGLQLKTIEAGRVTNDNMPNHACERITAFINKAGKSLSNIKIAVLGLAFKSDSGDLRHSPVLPFLSKIQEKGVKEINVFDPLVTDNDKLSINFSLSNDLKSSISGADCIAFMTGHECFKDKGLNFFAKHSKKGCLIFDGRRYFSRKEINQILDEGMNYRGIGRCA